MNEKVDKPESKVELKMEIKWTDGWIAGFKGDQMQNCRLLETLIVKRFH